MKRILIIDDDPIFTRIYGNVLQNQGFLVEVAAGGEAALEMLRYTQPDLILLDLFMRKVNGVTVLKYIRSRFNLAAVPVIVLSTSSMTRHIEASWRAGANRFLPKDDFAPDQLLEIVHQILAPSGAVEAELKLDAATGPKSQHQLFDDAEITLQTNLRKRLLRGGPKIVAKLLGPLKELRRKGEGLASSPFGSDLRSAMQELSRSAGLVGFARLEQYCGAVESLIGEVQAETEPGRPTALETVIEAIEVLPRLFTLTAANSMAHSLFPTLALLISDEPSSDWTVSAALEFANCRSLHVSGPGLALQLLEQNRFDIILIDADSPDLMELDVSSAIQGHPAILILGQPELEGHFRAMPQRVGEFVPKPLLLTELTAKAHSLILLAQIQEFERGLAQSKS